MGRIVVDVNDLRSGASTLRDASHNYDEVGRHISGIVDLSAIPVSLRGTVASSRAAAAGSAHQLASTVSGRAGELERHAAAFSAINSGGVGAWSFGGSGWGRLQSAINVANSVFILLHGGAMAFTRSASIASRVLRWSGTKAARSYAAKALPRLGRAAGHLRSIDDAVKPLAGAAKVLKRANPVLTVLGAGLDFKSHMDKREGVRQSAFASGGVAVGGVAGAAVGAAVAGAALGSVTFGIGAPVGVWAGAAAGGIAGGWVGEKVGGALGKLTKHWW